MAHVTRGFSGRCCQRGADLIPPGRALGDGPACCRATIPRSYVWTAATWECEPTVAPHRRAQLVWRRARVIAVRHETARTRSVVLDVPDWRGHRPGQLIDVRLTADDGFQATRCYSIASAPRPGSVELMVERVDDGVVSPWLAGQARAGDTLEVR